MTESQLIEQLETTPETVEFEQVISIISENYNYQPTRFSNGEVINEAGTNEGSCKLFAFGLLNQLSEKEMLACFGKYYRDDVLKHPEGSDHANIRTFMVSGWDAIKFDQPALTKK
ncbi:HopJ type III effector protein [Alkalimarinus sediminis]|uniref:HopJ type III effector protein n=1 Tax=Alkalimarinus sediminis TaxID=1632866 RepID=A0A9E8HJ75_9ALTE|nr:HopJ type III effector protein [Alkalimarinus sediminis]UZW75167.1 HopJ type III effector protein [Alkalimarinus sediminis]